MWNIYKLKRIWIPSVCVLVGVLITYLPLVTKQRFYAVNSVSLIEVEYFLGFEIDRKVGSLLSRLALEDFDEGDPGPALGTIQANPPEGFEVALSMERTNFLGWFWDSTGGTIEDEITDEFTGFIREIRKQGGSLDDALAAIMESGLGAPSLIGKVSIKYDDFIRMYRMVRSTYLAKSLYSGLNPNDRELIFPSDHILKPHEDELMDLERWDYGTAYSDGSSFNLVDFDDPDDVFFDLLASEYMKQFILAARRIRQGELAFRRWVKENESVMPHAAQIEQFEDRMIIMVASGGGPKRIDFVFDHEGTIVAADVPYLDPSLKLIVEDGAVYIAPKE